MLSGFENLNLSNGNDIILFDDTTQFNDFNTNFNSIDANGGSDTIEFDSSSVNGNLDFSNLSGFENLNLSSASDSIVLDLDEPSNIDGKAGDDNFSLDFSNIGNFTIEGGANSDTISLSGNAVEVTNDLDKLFGNLESFNGIEHIDISSLNGGAGFSSDLDKEFEITNSMVEDWLGSTSGDLKLSLTKEQAENLSFTTSDLQEHNSSISGSANSIDDGGVYNLDGDTTLTIDLIDVP